MLARIRESEGPVVSAGMETAAPIFSSEERRGGPDVVYAPLPPGAREQPRSSSVLVTGHLPPPPVLSRRVRSVENLPQLGFPPVGQRERRSSISSVPTVVRGGSSSSSSSAALSIVDGKKVHFADHLHIDDDAIAAPSPLLAPPTPMEGSGSLGPALDVSLKRSGNRNIIKISPKVAPPPPSPFTVTSPAAPPAVEYSPNVWPLRPALRRGSRYAAEGKGGSLGAAPAASPSSSFRLPTHTGEERPPQGRAAVDSPTQQLQLQRPARAVAQVTPTERRIAMRAALVALLTLITFLAVFL